METEDARKVLSKYEFRLLAIVAFATLGVGTVFYRLIENLSWIDSFYFSTITLTTIGYGDISPQTDAGKLFTVFYVIIGIAIIGAFVNAIIKRAAIRRHEESRIGILFRFRRKKD